MTLYCATTNAGKLREFRLAAGNGIEIEPLPNLDRIAPCVESGATFEENAEQKARHYGKHTAGYMFAEDSGLVVDGLGGEPGVHSARFSGPAATDEQNNRLVLERMASLVDRTARYVCVLALAKDGRVVRSFRGEVQGRILYSPRGENGFGYDPLFYYEQLGRSFAELSLPEKQTVSHRAQALALAVEFLKPLIVHASLT